MSFWAKTKLLGRLLVQEFRTLSGLKTALATTGAVAAPFLAKHFGIKMPTISLEWVGLIAGILIVLLVACLKGLYKAEEAAKPRFEFALDHDDNEQGTSTYIRLLVTNASTSVANNVNGQLGAIWRKESGGELVQINARTHTPLTWAGFHNKGGAAFNQAIGSQQTRQIGLVHSVGDHLRAAHHDPDNSIKKFSESYGEYVLEVHIASDQAVAQTVKIWINWTGNITPECYGLAA